MSNDKYFGLDVEHSVLIIDMPGNDGHFVRTDSKKLRETYERFNDEMAKVKSPEDKKKVLDSIFPNHSKNAQELSNREKELKELAAKKEKTRNDYLNNQRMQERIDDINKWSEKIIEEFPELAADVRNYAEATIRSAVTGEKNKAPKPAQKLPFWKKAIKPVAKLFGGKYNGLDNITRMIDSYGQDISQNPARKEIPKHMTNKVSFISHSLESQGDLLKAKDENARLELNSKIGLSEELFLEDKIYQAASKEFDTKAPGIIKKNKARNMLAQRGLIPETKGTKDVSGVVKVDQNIMAQQAAKKYSR